MVTLPFPRLIRLWCSVTLMVGASLPATTYADSRQTKLAAPACTVVINEFMSAKQRVLADDDGDYSDWIELYNCTDEPIDLTGWHLSDRYDDPEQWKFPEVSLSAKGYMVIWASGKDQTRPDQPLHTNFSIAASGEPLILSDPQGEMVDDVSAIALNKHEVAGRHPDGTGKFAILKEATPGQANAAAMAQAWLDAPTFSRESGFYDKPFKLSLSHPDKDAAIYYTLDGSEPDPDNLQGSTYRYKNSYQQPPEKEGEKVVIQDNFLYNEYITHEYNKAIPIKDRKWEPDRISQISTTFDEKPDYFPQPKVAEHWQNSLVIQANRVIKEGNRLIRRINRLANRAVRKAHYWRTGEVRPIGNKTYLANIPEITWRKYQYLFKGTPVRAIAVKETPNRTITSSIATHTFFIGDREQFSLPVIALTIPEKALFDYDEGIMVAGKTYDEWLAGQEEPEPRRCSWAANWKWSSKQTDKVAGHSTFYQSDGETITISTQHRVHGGC